MTVKIFLIGLDIRSLTISIICLSFFSCITSKRKTTGQEITAIQLKSSMPIPSGDTELITTDLTLQVYYYQDLSLYQIPIIRTYSKTMLDKEGDVKSSELVKAEIIYKYFIAKKDSPIGVMYDTLNTNREQRMPVDSFLKINTLTSLSTFLKFTKAQNNDSLVNVIQLSKNETVEKYVPKVKYDQTYNDSTLLYFKKGLSSINFSFSPEMDSLRNAKLVKVRLIFNHNDAGSDKFSKAAKEVLFSMETLSVTNKEEIMALFTKLERLVN